MSHDQTTTVLGAVGAAIAAVQIYSANGGNLADWKLWIVPVLVAVYGYFTNKPSTLPK